MACKVTCYFQLFSSVLLSVLRTSINVLSKSKSRNYVTWIANLTKSFLSVYWQRPLCYLLLQGELHYLVVEFDKECLYDNEVNPQHGGSIFNLRKQADMQLLKGTITSYSFLFCEFIKSLIPTMLPSSKASWLQHAKFYGANAKGGAKLAYRPFIKYVIIFYGRRS